MADRRRRTVFGVDMDPLTLGEVLQLCARAIDAQHPIQIGVLNAAKVVHLHSNALLRESLLDCDLLLADGQSVVWASRLLRQPLPERVAGIDLFDALLAMADRDERAVYLLGATPEVLQRLEDVIRTRFPHLRLVGSRDGYFTDAESAQVANEIRRSGADMLFLGMVTPKKETFIGIYGPSLGVPVIHGVGGSFDVMAGVVRRAPKSWQHAGLEWAYRLRQEPGRLWKRYLTTNTAFVALVGRELVRPTPPFVSTRS